ncbi:MAG: hypothetical protein EPO13_01855 [Actinomycetota bacterium]|nr:MAG: hypothetical protein EPO13_01855 [Actinomycetota bacterium]
MSDSAARPAENDSATGPAEPGDVVRRPAEPGDVLRRHAVTADGLEFQIGTVAQIGSAIIMYAEPPAGLEREYNRWYEDDHTYAASLAGPGSVAHRRWVAPARYKQLRPAATLFGDPARGSYLIAFWILAGMQEEWYQWLARQEQVLRDDERWEFPKDHIYTGSFTFVSEQRAPGGPRAISALDREFGGMIAVAIERQPGGELTGIEQWAESLRSARLPLSVVLTPLRLFKSVLSAPADPADDPFALVIFFCDGEPDQVWLDEVEPRLADVPSIAGATRVGFASPFLSTVPGTDRYVDEL